MITKERRKALYSQLAPLIESLETTTLHIKSTSSPTQSILRIGSPIEAFQEMILPVFQALNMCTVSYFETAEGLIDLLKEEDRKSTRLNSSHVAISYAVFCLKKKKDNNNYE